MAEGKSEAEIAAEFYAHGQNKPLREQDHRVAGGDRFTLNHLNKAGIPWAIVTSRFNAGRVLCHRL